VARVQREVALDAGGSGWGTDLAKFLAEVSFLSILWTGPWGAWDGTLTGHIRDISTSLLFLQYANSASRSVRTKSNYVYMPCRPC